MSGNDSSAIAAILRSRDRLIDGRIQYVLRAIESDPSRDIAALARLVTLSPSRLSHLFKRETRRSLHSCLANLRLEKAAQLLAETPASVKEVSYIVGYQHSASFVRAFRKKFGRTPNSFRGNAYQFATEDSCFG
jgi:transcriptional regulator GlxA family with amidase domain